MSTLLRAASFDKTSENVMELWKTAVASIKKRLSVPRPFASLLHVSPLCIVKKATQWWNSFKLLTSLPLSVYRQQSLWPGLKKMNFRDRCRTELPAARCTRCILHTWTVRRVDFLQKFLFAKKWCNKLTEKSSY